MFVFWFRGFWLRAQGAGVQKVEGLLGVEGLGFRSLGFRAV